jgi:mannosyltransferase PIG-V
VLVALDLLIGVYALMLLVRLLTRIDLGPLTPDRAEKPILILLLAVPVRLTIGGRSWLLERAIALAAPLGRIRVPAWKMPPAVSDALFAAIVTRAAAVPIAFIANLIFPDSKAPGFAMPFDHQRFAEIFAAWDSGWYFDIARHGYYWRADGQSSVPFFPLYPMLMRAVAVPLGGSDRAVWLAGVLVSCAAFVLALVFLHRLTERVFGDLAVARRTVLYVAVFPFAIFFTRVYSESVFFLMSVLAVSRAYDRRWLQASLWGALATLARPNGILIGLPLFVMAIADRPEPREGVRRLLALSLVPLALVGYCAFVYSLSGDPLGWLTAEKQWGYSLGHPPWRLLLTMIARVVKHGWYDVFFAYKMAPFRLFHGVTALLFLALTPAVFKRLGVAMGLYVVVSLLVPLSSNELEGIGRYASVLFPVFMLAGTVTSERVQQGILIVSCLFQTLFICLFVTLRPIY